MIVDLAHIEEIFGSAVGISDAAARANYLDEACGGDGELRRRVEALLAAHEAPGNFLNLSEADSFTVPSIPVSENPGSTIGHYKLLEQIGEGGFAIVFMAEQQQPLSRSVAIKIVKLGMDTRQIVARFEAERQALAMMDHPSIAKAFDAGATESGRPYFVMELVKGTPITEYCDSHNLSIDARLDLFVQVCQAVQHAHQKGVIHRDIKPSNVIVTTQDDRPLAKVIDFGIAKATQTSLTDKTLFTDFRQLLGTPAYMSPEQANGSLDIDTRSDVYSLGVLLYELLAGAPPFDPKELQSKSFSELQRIICEVEPPALSRRLSTLAADMQLTKARERQCDPQQLGQVICGDIEWIVMRALDKDRTRRYQAASAFADDIERYLRDQPVEARPATGWYRLKKLARRNKGTFVAGATVVAALTVGLTVATIGLIQARRQAEVTRLKAAQKEQVALFLKDTLRAIGLPAESELTDLDRLFDDAALLAAEDQVESANLLRLRATLRARIGRWDEATADCLKANELALDGGDWSFDSAILLLKAERYDEYRRVCHAYLARVAGKRDFVTADMAAKVALLLPVGGPDFALACELADFAATETEPAWHVTVVCLGKALAEYRRERFDSAHEWAGRVISSESASPRYRATAYFIEAAAYAQAWQSELAHAALEKGDQLMNEPHNPFSKVFGDTWCDRVIADLLRHEAANLLNPIPVASP